ncbi:hypothetical protein PEC18_26200 [Paucibacter sp. O1-1]|nr:hypothetical protein [Paucibacter sp. O1-1]MDA3829232.1 hypothetical protein [Paucibacter sp. O1-1]
MLRRTMGVAALAMGVLLAGCAAPPAKQAFNSAAASHVKTVAVLRQPNQDSFEAVVLAHPGASFGLIGGLVAAADMQAKSTRLSAALDPQQTKLQERFSAKLAERLSGLGYEASVLEMPKSSKDDEVLAVAKRQQTADAYLSIQLVGAYWAAGPSSDYFPRVLAKVRKMDGRSGQVLYEDIFSYGYVMPNAPTIHLASDAKFRFADIDALCKDGTTTRDGLLAGLDAIAEQIATDLRRQ